MKFLIKQATILSAASPFHRTSKDILVQDGMIRMIENHIDAQPDMQVIDAPGLHVSTGWVDSFAHFCDPGFEYRETLQTGANAATAGGFTDVLVIPNNQPVTDNKSQVEYIKNKGAHSGIHIHPLGAVTKNAEGKELAEMYDMHAAGAIAFTDGLQAIQNGGLMIKALLYVKTFNGVVIQIPEDKSIAANGLMNEGIVSTQLGMQAKPAIAEELMVVRDIKLAQYTNSRLHFTGISTAAALQHIKAAKAAGIAVTCSVSPAHLYFSDEDLRGYDTQLKINPPLRTPADRAALQAGVLDGTIDCIASHHQPQGIDQKLCEFEYAKNGMSSLETAFAVANTALNHPAALETIIERFTTQPREIFKLTEPALEPGAMACLTLFNPHTPVTFTPEHWKSKSKNTPFFHQPLKGKVIGTIYHHHSYFNL